LLEDETSHICIWISVQQLAQLRIPAQLGLTFFLGNKTKVRFIAIDMSMSSSIVVAHTCTTDPKMTRSLFLFAVALIMAIMMVPPTAAAKGDSKGTKGGSKGSLAHLVPYQVNHRK
jgi:hypothetical protein